MPIYEYRCRGCGVVAEILHGMSEVPQLHCTCGSDDIVRKISLCSVISHQTLDSARKQETSKRHDDMKADLWENYGVSGVKPLPNIERKGYDQIYQDVKTGGGQIKEKMQATREVNLAKMEKKNKAKGKL